jgi:predicted TIM-barrel fold metal-dependent hydrolase
MDAQGLECTFLFPTLAVCVEHFMKDDPEQLYANLHAFNEWLDEDWGFACQGRIYAAPLLSLLDRERAVAELDWALAKGARVVGLRPGPAFGRSPGDPYFDPFWARIDEAGVCVAFHIAESGYNELFSTQFGEQPNPSSHKQSAFQWSCFYGDRPIMDTVASLVFSNLFGRFPNVRIASVENGSEFLPDLFRKLHSIGRKIPGFFRDDPVEAFRRNVWINPFWEDDVNEVVELMGADRVIFGSDWPHIEGMPRPLDYVAELKEFDDEQRRLILRENTAELNQLRPA